VDKEVLVGKGGRRREKNDTVRLRWLGKIGTGYTCTAWHG
jgi:hypothetical protein